MKTPRHILIAEMPHILLSFLIKKKALGPFLTAVTEYNSMSDDTAIKWTKHHYSERLIADVFLITFEWSHTLEGFNFWLEINIEWEGLWIQKIS